MLEKFGIRSLLRLQSSGMLLSTLFVFGCLAQVTVFNQLTEYAPPTSSQSQYPVFAVPDGTALWITCQYPTGNYSPTFTAVFYWRLDTSPRAVNIFSQFYSSPDTSQSFSSAGWTPISCGGTPIQIGTIGSTSNRKLIIFPSSPTPSFFISSVKRSFTRYPIDVNPLIPALSTVCFDRPSTIWSLSQLASSIHHHHSSVRHSHPVRCVAEYRRQQFFSVGWPASIRSVCHEPIVNCHQCHCHRHPSTSSVVARHTPTRKWHILHHQPRLSGVG